jgi:hypothetical protein
VYLNIINSDDKITEYGDMEDEDDDTNYDIVSSAVRVIEDIEKGQIFDDIRIDFDSIIDNIAPEDNPSRLNQMLVSYYEEIHEVLQKRLDECQDIIEEYMTQLIESKKKNVQKHMHNIAYGTGSKDRDIENNVSNMDIASITKEHNKRLDQLREQYEHFLKNAEGEFFSVLKSVKGESEINSEDHDPSPKENNLREEYNKSNKAYSQNTRQYNQAPVSRTQSHVSISTLNENFSQNDQPQYDDQMYTTGYNTNQRKTEENKNTPKFTHDSTGQNSGEGSDSKINQSQSSNGKYSNSANCLPLKLSASKRIKQRKQVKQNNVERDNRKIVYLWGSGKDGRLANYSDSSEPVPNLVKSEHNFIIID